jgi:hypothetical protein
LFFAANINNIKRPSNLLLLLLLLLLWPKSERRIQLLLSGWPTLGLRRICWLLVKHDSTGFSQFDITFNRCVA